MNTKYANKQISNREEKKMKRKRVKDEKDGRWKTIKVRMERGTEKTNFSPPFFKSEREKERERESWIYSQGRVSKNIRTKIF